LARAAQSHTANHHPVKAFRSLLSGEDIELKGAHQAFQKAVQGGRDIVQNATLSAAEKTKFNLQAVHVDVRKTLSVVERLVENMSSVAISTTQPLNGQRQFPSMSMAVSDD